MKNYLEPSQEDANDTYLELGLIRAAELTEEQETVAMAQAVFRGALKGVNDKVLAKMNNDLKQAVKVTIT